MSSMKVTKEELAARVDAIIALGERDEESAHMREDELHLDVIRMFCPEWVRNEIARLTAVEFGRWYS